MRVFRRKIRLREALVKVLGHVSPVGVEEVPLDRAFGRVLAEDVRSAVDVPPLDRAARDGYAVRAADTFGATPERPVRLRLSKSGVSEGECVQIQTGEPLPEGSDAVLMLEFTRRLGDEIEVLKPVTPGKNVSFRGEDVRRGDVVLRRGRVLRPHDVGMLAAIRRRAVKVYRKPRVGIISTGDELLDPLADEPQPPEAFVFDSNSYALAALVEEAGATPLRLGIVRDAAGVDGLKDAILGGLAGSDVLLVSGGSSVGERDFLADALTELGEILFHGVALRPGEPAGFALVDIDGERKPVFMLPGFPVAAIAAFELLVRPALQRMQGMMPAERPSVLARAKRKIPSELGRVDFVRVRLEFGAGAAAEPHAVPIRTSGAGVLSSVTRADGFLLVPEEKEGVEQGELVKVFLF
ncbi:MAG: molybdopterin molybdotransferase MoeA [Candidatus Alkanophagales archaeon]